MSEITWRDESNVFELRQVASAEGFELMVTSVVGGSSTESNPFQWWVERDGAEVDDGPARTTAEARAAAEAVVRALKIGDKG